ESGCIKPLVDFGLELRETFLEDIFVQPVSRDQSVYGTITKSHKFGVDLRQSLLNNGNEKGSNREITSVNKLLFELGSIQLLRLPLDNVFGKTLELLQVFE